MGRAFKDTRTEGKLQLEKGSHKSSLLIPKLILSTHNKQLMDRHFPDLVFWLIKLLFIC